MNSKGQISLEVLIIMSVLTIGALVFGTYYLQTVNSNIRKETFDFDGSRAFGIKTPQSVSCGDGICNGSENCVSCPVDCGTCPPTGCTVGQLTAVNFSPPGGTYTETKNVSLSYTGSCPDVNIFYTWDGTTPTSSSTLYQNLITISNTTTIKAKIFANNNSISGPETTQTYTISAIALCPAGGGNGTLANPKIICTPDDLNAIRNNLDWHYVLGQDIDLNVSPYNTGDGWLPIPSFSGSINGNHFVIKNLYVKSRVYNPANVLMEKKSAFIFDLENSGIIKNLGLVDVNISNILTQAQVSTLLIKNYGTIENCFSTGSIIAGFNTGWQQNIGFAGGLVFTNIGQINNSYSDINISGHINAAGGFVMDNDENIENSYSKGIIFGTFGSAVGGFVQKNSGLINNSYSEVNVSGGTNVGGFVAQNLATGEISLSRAYSDVNGSYRVGGFVGFNAKGGVINSCFSQGNVIFILPSQSTGGGFVGENGGQIENCYSRGNIIRSKGTNTNFAGFCGYSQSYSTVFKSYSTGNVKYTNEISPNDKGFFAYGTPNNPRNNFWDKNSSQQEYSYGDNWGWVAGKTTSQMKTQGTFTDWDFTNIWAINPTINNGYPYLRNNPPR